jgi:hypothetical protein
MNDSDKAMINRILVTMVYRTQYPSCDNREAYILGCIELASDLISQLVGRDFDDVFQVIRDCDDNQEEDTMDQAEFVTKCLIKTGIIK